MASYKELTDKEMHRAVQQSITAALETLNDPSNIEKRDFIYQSEPDTADLGSNDYPLLWLEDYSFTTDDDGRTLNGNTLWVDITVEIVLHTRDEGANYKIWFDDLSDQLSTLFTSMKGKRVELGERKFGNANIERNIRSTNVRDEGIKTITREMEVSFRAQVQFS